MMKMNKKINISFSEEDSKNIEGVVDILLHLIDNLEGEALLHLDSALLDQDDIAKAYKVIYKLSASKEIFISDPE